MQIQELIGVKKHITKDSKMVRVERTLEMHGFELLGDGASGSVWRHPQLSYVLKIFTSKDVSYLDYVRMVIAGPSNPHFPRFKGRPIQLTSNVMAIRMERLKPWMHNNASALDRAIWAIMVSVDDGPSWKQQMKLRFEATQRDVAIALKKWPQLEDAVDRLIAFQQSHSHAIWDIRDQNIMKRGSVPVFTDPFTW